MKILIVSQYFWPEAFRINDLVRALRDASHDVTVLTAIPNYPQGKFFEGYGVFKRARESFEGIPVRRVPIVSRGKGHGARLAVNYLSFLVSASVFGPALARGDYDVIFVFEPSPVTVAVPAIFLRKLKGIPLIFWVQDLWPDNVTAVAGGRRKLASAALEKLVRWIYARCDLILVQSRAFVNSVRARTPERVPIRYFPNSAEEVYTTTPPRSGDNILGAGFRVVFAGNIGAAQDFPTILGAAEILRAHSDIHWDILGEGRVRAFVEEQIAGRGLGSQVHLLGSFPLEQMPRYFSSADALLVTLRRDPSFALTVPSKIQSCLASGRPIVAAIEGEAARIVEEANAGICCAPESPEALASAVLKLYRIPLDEREKLGQNGRAYFEREFERTMLLEKLEGWMTDLVTRTAPRE